MCSSRSVKSICLLKHVLADMKLRLDKLLLDRGIVPSRERAQALILAGRVLVNEQKVEKPGTQITPDAQIKLLGDDLRYVSRGGLKLERALQHWNIDLNGRSCMDVGASTGGFTDCMLQHAAARVIAIDTGYGQIDNRLRQDPRVSLLERTNARYLEDNQLELAVDFFAMDVSFISATLVLPAVLATIRHKFTAQSEFEGVILVKPQFEAGREAIGKGGIVRDEGSQLAAVERVRRAVEEHGGSELDVIDSPILGAEGNREFLLHSRFTAQCPLPQSSRSRTSQSSRK
jgi:23S rRNA (cytidine1920-2'-O)/16S rRNA (cytidine1409-2'-O)-methyltransferase